MVVAESKGMTVRKITRNVLWAVAAVLFLLAGVCRGDNAANSSISCVVLVPRNPYFGATDKKGRYTISNIPAGTYKLKAWHERLPGSHKTITVPENGEVAVDFTLGVNHLPKL